MNELYGDESEVQKHYNESSTMRRLLTFTRLIISVQSICLREENHERRAGPAHACEEHWISRFRNNFSFFMKHSQAFSDWLLSVADCWKGQTHYVKKTGGIL